MTEEELQGLLQKAEAGDAEAQYELGCYYYDLAEEKLSSLKESIPSGSPQMRWPYSIGERNYFDRMVEDERAEAFRFFEDAAKQGHLAAIYELSICYANGKGTAPFTEKAKELLMEAAEKGYAPAQFDVGMQTYFGKERGVHTLVEVKPDYASSVIWFRKSAEQEYPLAQYYLGLCYEEGKGVEKNYEEAFRLYSLAAESELLWALCALGRCYENGLGVEADIDKTIEYYTHAANQGDGEAAEALDRLGA